MLKTNQSVIIATNFETKWTIREVDMAESVSRKVREIVDKIYAIDPDGGQTLYSTGKVPTWI